MTKWIEGIDNPVVWAVMVEIDGTPVSFQRCWIAYITKA